MSKSDELMEEEEEEEDQELLDDDDDDDDESDEFEEKFNVLKASIEENKFAYQNYVDIIDLTKKHGDLNNLRGYREKMSELFPLTEKLWLDWLCDEQKLIESNADRDRVYELFEKAVQDYLSIKIWVEYIQFSISSLNEPKGKEKIRSICERAVSIGGYHVKAGYTVWQVYRELETAILSGLQQSLLGAINTKKTEDEIAEQSSRIIQLFKRQLKVSQNDLRDTFEELKEFDSDSIDEQTKKDFQDSVAKLKELEIYENSLENSSNSEDKLENYKNYLKYELKSNENLNRCEPRIQCLFERAIADGSNCLDSSIWLMYTNYLNENLKNENDRVLLLKIYKRAVRNSPWTGRLWINYALSLEYNNKPAPEIKKIYNEGMNAGLQTSAEYLEIWHAYLDFLRRNLFCNKDRKSVSEEEEQTLRDTFKTAINQLYEFFKHEGDPTLSLEKYWAYVEAKYFKNIEQARKIWNELIIQKGMNQFCSEWIEFYEFEREFGDEKHQRKILLRGLNDSVDSKESLCELLLKFEKQNGTIESYSLAKLKCDKIIDEINAENARIAQEELKKKQSKKPKQQEPPQQQQNKQPKQKDNNLKRKKSEDESNVQTKHESKRDNDGFAVPSLPSAANLTQPLSKKVKSKNEEESGKPEVKQPTQAAIMDGSKRIANNMVFLSNLAYDVKQEDIENVFKNQPGYQAVRLVRHWSGKTKGFGYADFDSQQNALEALKLDRAPVNGRPMFISQCEDKSLKLGSSNAFRYANGLEKNKLFIANLPFTCDKAQLENIFKTFGTLKELRVVTYRNGKSKGLAYVEYENAADASKALLQTDNMLVGENQISVALSNPPKREQEVGRGDSEVKRSNPIVSSLGSGSVKSSAKMERGKGHLISLMQPRSIATKPNKPVEQEQSMQVDDQSNTSKQLKNIQLNDKVEEEKKVMTNDDFRSLLLKKN